MVIAQLISFDLPVRQWAQRFTASWKFLLVNILSDDLSVILMNQKCVKKCIPSPGVTVGVG